MSETPPGDRRWFAEPEDMGTCNRCSRPAVLTFTVPATADGSRMLHGAVCERHLLGSRWPHRFRWSGWACAVGIVLALLIEWWYC